MGLFRLVILIALIAAAIWLWRRLKRPAPGAAKGPAATPMVRCEQCGVHVPEGQALRDADRWYCSAAHLKQGSTSGER